MGTVAGPKTIFEALDSIRNAGLDELHDHICRFVDSSRVPSSYISTLTQSQQTICYRFFLLAYFITGGREAPRAMQLQAALATYEKRDSAVITRTGSGKTLIIALSILLDNPSSGATITISPLKHLQLTQAADFCNKYKINTIAINDDTSRTQKFWDEMIYNVKTKTSGTAKHFIVTTEQMFKSKEGHITRFGNLIRTLAFRKTIRRVFVDEAHFIYFAGTSRYKIPAFRPSWGRLNEIKIFLPSIPWQVLTATSPPHVLSVIEAAVLRPGYELVQITSNRPNTTYATHCVVKSLDVMENYDCFLAGPLAHQKKILLFFNNRNLGRRVASYLNSKLPEFQRSKGLIKHYDSIMSKEYLEKVHTDFAGENGTCKILCATSAEAVGIDFADVDIVGYMDIPQDECDDLQRGGRVVRRFGKCGLYVIFYEPWVLEIDVKEFDNPLMDQNDPDRPRGPLKPTSNKKERAALSAILLLQGHESTCIRAFKAEYLHDKAPDALQYSGPFCCDRHNDGFNLQDFLPGPIYRPQQLDSSSKRKPNREKYRLPKAQRVILQRCLEDWRRIEHEADVLKSVRPRYFILSDANIATLAKTCPGLVSSPAGIVALLEETEEWEREWAVKVHRGISCEFARYSPCWIQRY